MKSETTIDDLAAAPRWPLPWFGVHNCQARNFMREAMAIGDPAFFCHSGWAEPGIAGICEVCSEPSPDETRFATTIETKAGPGVNPYFDSKPSPDKPCWRPHDVRIVSKTRYLPLAELHRHPKLANMRLLARGNRLSITPKNGLSLQRI